MKLAIAISLCLCCGACSRSNAIIVGSKSFTEQIILGEIAAQQIERKLHLPVERRLGLGGTLLAHEALRKGQIDLYPEYTGTAGLAILKQPPSSDPTAAYMQVKDSYRERFHLIWLPPLGFNDTFAMVVRSHDAEQLQRPALSAAASRSWRLGVGFEFLTRADGLTRLDSEYRLRWSGSPLTMDLGLVYQALAQDHVDMIAANSTDGLLANPVYKMLADDKKAFPPYNACFVVREDLLTGRPGVNTALTMLSNRISDEAMRNLNRQVDVNHKPVTEVVHEFLATQP
ncbi:MAG TPA: glycine betaine ABC transporter substrate-binding protein [Bryobacteraceae bacterium]|nr:glycine betaine ABC transporter substrate-binding protein [Bryobacteraceae bacterium]